MITKNYINILLGNKLFILVLESIVYVCNKPLNFKRNNVLKDWNQYHIKMEFPVAWLSQGSFCNGFYSSRTTCITALYEKKKKKKKGCNHGNITFLFSIRFMFLIPHWVNIVLKSGHTTDALYYDFDVSLMSCISQFVPIKVRVRYWILHPAWAFTWKQHWYNFVSWM